MQALEDFKIFIEHSGNCRDFPVPHIQDHSGYTHSAQLSTDAEKHTGTK